MRAAIVSLIKRHNRQQIALDVEEELRFHVEMLERKYVQQGMSSLDASARAGKRFGDLQRVKKQCVQIRSRNTLLRRVLKNASVLVGLTGLVIHFLSPDRNISHIGDTLVIIAIFGRLLIYVRGLTPRNPECS